MSINRVIATAALLASVATPPAYAQQSSAVPDKAEADAATHTQAHTQVRQVTTLATGWRFHKDQADAPASADAIAPAFDDATWSQVSIPHTWNRVGFYRPSPDQHINRADNIDKTQGKGWYRLRFTPDASAAGRRAWLEFDAVSRVASVWLNGVKLGDHAGGFSRFRLDATKALKPGVENVLVVRADNTSVTAQGSETADVLPLTGDFFVHGGIYRPVRLILSDPVHLDLADHGGPGFTATTAAVTAQGAQIDVRARLANDGVKRTRAAVAISLFDKDGRLAASSKNALAVSPGAVGEIATKLNVAAPHLWQGVEDPYLYTLQIDVLDAKGRLLDQVRQPFGIRTVRIDPDQGLFLNGKHVQLHGVGYHQDREGKGWAISADDVAQDMEIMREMGVNTIRLTHYQHGPAIHDLADRYGLLLWDEIPLVSGWTRRGELEPRAALVANADQQLRELIHQNVNHPSVVTWGIANEVDFGNSFPAFLTGYPDGKTPDPMPLLRTLQGIAHAEDPSRPTALATCCEGRLFNDGVDIPTTALVADLGGANRYFGWYFGVPGDLGPHLDSLHAKRPRQPLSVTEYGAGGATTMHSDDVLGGPIDSRGARQPEEYESYIHEEAWKALKVRPYLWATWLWNSFDFATTIRAEGDAQDINTKGLVTYDRQIRKDAYYFYKANWTQTPTVHINGRRYVDRAYSVTDVRVYSNAPATELFVNGRSQGRRAACPDQICVWQAVALDRGTNAVEARGQFPQGETKDAVNWTVSADAWANWRIDAGTILAPAASVRFGSDAFFTGGHSGTLEKAADYGKPAVPARIEGTPNIAVAATYREGTFSYHVPLRNGRYTVALTFVEPSQAPGQRVFDVTANGKLLVKQIDIAAIAGTARAVRRTATVLVSEGKLDLSFKPSKGEAIVSAIEIASANTRP
ncbi:glycoside hydrolase family protein [Novosphingobium sp. Rr 2-17]|uniref:glycoside hydrolase family 2 TIM barrel-domain containing protein n=1 Tax=Novosphingobium sp. Rr 2-17 TaxID=555793 RepID=UPI0002698BD9|nr:glycoside hydrolase family 2 TIM barrel-domain containing protein [Novosphingobium sp. Rr 2-17]EIZ78647.1 glycoside hydrolase family protein [Novosphingobium sp. Rr 2-17]